MRDIERSVIQEYAARFGAPPDVVASAPGRVNLIGEHTDYNGGFVLPCAIERRVAVAMGHGTGGLYSTDFGELRSSEGCKDRSWADYPRSVAWALTESGHALGRFQATVSGDVPLGSGLSSSAAIECAFALCLDRLFGLGLSRQELAVVCQRGENGYVGVNSGIMDQFASLCCEREAALLLDCRSLETRTVPLDLDSSHLSLVVCDTQVSRSLEDTPYNERRAACEAAARTLEIGSLRDATMEDLERLSGEELLCARHVITENIRVLQAVDALRESDFNAFGALLTASHASLRDDFRVSTPELDAFVETADDCGALGARLTGAGFGGCALGPYRQRSARCARGKHVTVLRKSRTEATRAVCFPTFHRSRNRRVGHTQHVVVRLAGFQRGAGPERSFTRSSMSWTSASLVG